MRLETKLARVFTSLADAGKSTDSVAAGILAIVAEAKAKDVAAFDPLVRAAYTANGWNPRPGRPTDDNKGLDPVPPTVRTYVTAVRRAFRFGVNVAKCETFYDLRKALRKARPSASRSLVLPSAVAGHFVGVDFAATPKDVNGALIHDVGVVLTTLPKPMQALFEKQLKRLVTQYLPHAQLQSANAPEDSAAAK